VAVAEEGAIKIREIARLPTLAMELSEFLHGSINVARAGVGVVTIALDDLSRGLSRQVVAAASVRGATTIAIGHDASVDAELHLRLPDTPPSVGAFLAVGELQRLARDTGLRAGIDPDAPPGLEKITRIGPGVP
jgi:glutamine---fructose-6-phosphate transaminase (isomerizing)